MRACIGVGAFEEICREWVQLQARERGLPFDPELVGSEWNAAAQIDVAAVNHREKKMLLGECKWTGDRIRHDVVTDLIQNKTPKALPSGWTPHYMFFSRSGFTSDALKEIEHVSGRAVTFSEVDRDLRRAFVTT